MKRTIIIVLAGCIVAVAGYAYVRHAREKSASTQAADAFRVAPRGAAAGSAAIYAPGDASDLVRQLPAGASAVIFADMAALRAAPIGSEISSLAPAQAQDPEYTAFVRATGFDYSRDLDRAALALWPKSSPTTVVAIAQGKFDRRKIERYALRSGRLVKQGKWKIYEVLETNPPRTIRLVFLSPTEIALADGPGLSKLLVPGSSDRLDPEMSRRVDQVGGAAIFGVARTPNLPKDLGIDPAHSAQLAHLLQSVHNITVAAQPAGQNLSVSAAAECDSTLDAFQLSTALEGLVWMGRAALADPKTQQQIGPQWPALTALLKAADVSHDSHFVRLHLSITPQILRAAGSGPQAAATK